ncbi:inhibitor of Bruton tyrosine kinase [Plutella xylostella]|uniref:inhibitor of Bruton tyrosine kinase n=1 Tax=Plutella xylostella TaxID=51655 RepID=UPI00203224CC|nr:inhibitor of Bruton tyrosine kinase [Plutella xylostella]
MSKGGHLEVDCTRRCKSRSHGRALTSAITKRSVADEALASFIKGTCANFPQAFDFEGRTAFHMAASRGRCKLMEWLARHSSEAFINARDRESGYTPLHRSIFYGQIHSAVALMKIGVNTDIVDKDDYKALEHAMLDRHYMYKESNSPCDAYVWGSNCNYTLGTHSQQKLPDLLTCFSRTNTDVKQVCLGKFHSLYLCSTPEPGSVYACGQLARAGASHATSLRPVLLRLTEPCVQVAVTVDTSVFLMQSGVVLQYTQNNSISSQSTSKTPSTLKLPSIKPILKLSNPLGVCASRVHAVVWNAHAVYTWGTNVGQLGHSEGEGYVEAPKRVAISVNSKEHVRIELAHAGDAASLVATSRGDVYLLHRHKAKKIAIKQINLRQVCVDAKVSETGVYSRVTVLLLTNVGQLHIWQDQSNRLTRCVFGLNHQIFITHVTLTHDAMYFTTKYGEAFIGYVSRKNTPSVEPTPTKRDKDRDSQKSALVKFLEKDDCTSVRLTRVPNVHRAVSISVDTEGLNFACLQTKPTCGLSVSSIPDLSPTCMAKHMETLMETTAEDDILHDVVFRIGTKLYPAHMFIVASSSEHLYKLFQDQKLQNPSEKPTITLENVLPEVFDRILRFVYTGSCDVVETGPCGLKIRREDIVKDVKKDDDAVENELDFIENPSEISAFEVYNSQSDKSTSKKSARRRHTETPPRSLYCDPVKLVQAGAKRMGVLTLHKMLDKFFYRDGAIHRKDTTTTPKNPVPLWDRATFPELVDTHVRSKDGVLVSAHKCVLAARLEYFHGMFMHSWTESKQLSTVTLPVNHGILLPIINFLYTDRCPEVESSESLDYICSVLIVADQLFISRLREMCESALANMITLKNCAELCQFAHTYNATQLKQYCMEFISLNIGSILENRNLEVLDDTLLEDISKYYCKFNPIMSSRVITPFYNAPSDDTIDECAKSCPVDMGYTDLEYKREDSLEVKKKRSSKKIEYTESEKARKRYETVSSVTSLDLSHDTSGDITLSLSKMAVKETEKGGGDKKNNWIEIPTSQQKQQKVVQARLKAIVNAKDILNETPNESFVTLSKNSSFTAISSSPLENTPPSASRMSVSPKDSPFADLARSPQGNLVISHVGPKLSQKQRKKLALQGGEPTQNLNDYLNKVETTPTKPANPWKVVEMPTTSATPSRPVKPVGFTQILSDQKKQKDDFSRIMTKPLNMTQLEDKAIEDLEKFYNIHQVDDELISVRRIELQVSSPQWPLVPK